MQPFTPGFSRSKDKASAKPRLPKNCAAVFSGARTLRLSVVVRKTGGSAAESNSTFDPFRTSPSFDPVSLILRNRHLRTRMSGGVGAGVSDGPGYPIRAVVGFDVLCRG